jgi:hypothetical protein
MVRMSQCGTLGEGFAVGLVVVADIGVPPHSLGVYSVNYGVNMADTP